MFASICLIAIPQATPIPSPALQVTSRDARIRYDFQRVAATGDTFPEGGGVFANPLSPCIRNGRILLADSANGRLYVFDTSLMVEQAMTFIGCQDTPTEFSGISRWSLGEAASAFSAGNACGYGAVYWKPIGGPRQVVASTSMAVPGTTATSFSFFTWPSISGDDVAFFSFGSTYSGVYSNEGGSLRVVADLTTLCPGAGSNFTQLDHQSVVERQPKMCSGTIVFWGAAPGLTGLFADTGGVLSTLVDSTTLSPSDGTPFTSFGQFAATGNHLVFAATSATRAGVYSIKNGFIRRVLDNHTQIPDHPPFGFSRIDSVAADDRSVAVAGGGTPALGIFSNIGGRFHRVIDSTQTLDGRRPWIFDIAPQGVEGRRIVFNVLFTDFTQAVYLATRLS